MSNTLLYSSVLGDKQLPKLVILHGLFGSGENWRSIAKDLATQYQVCLLDLRNHGRSFHSPSMDYKEMAMDIKKWLDDNHIKSTHLLGHSMGGKVAMVFALCYPQYIDRLIIADIAPAIYQQQEHLTLIKAMQAIDLSQFNTRLGVDRALKQSISDNTIRQFLLKNLKQQKEVLQWQINLDALGQQMDTIVAFPQDLSSTYSKKTLFFKR